MCGHTVPHMEKAIAICPRPLLGGIIKKMSNYFMICVHFTMSTVTNPGVWGDLPWTQHNVDEPWYETSGVWIDFPWIWWYHMEMNCDLESKCWYLVWRTLDIVINMTCDLRSLCWSLPWIILDMLVDMYITHDVIYMLECSLNCDLRPVQCWSLAWTVIWDLCSVRVWLKLWSETSVQC